MLSILPAQKPPSSEPSSDAFRYLRAFFTACGLLSDFYKLFPYRYTALLPGTASLLPFVLGGNWNSLLKNLFCTTLSSPTGIFFRNHSAACCHLHRVSICQHLTCQTPEKFQPAYGAYAYVPLRYSCRFCQSSPIFESASRPPGPHSRQIFSGSFTCRPNL